MNTETVVVIAQDRDGPFMPFVGGLAGFRSKLLPSPTGVFGLSFPEFGAGFGDRELVVRADVDDDVYPGIEVSYPQVAVPLKQEGGVPIRENEVESLIVALAQIAFDEPGGLFDRVAFEGITDQESARALAREVVGSRSTASRASLGAVGIDPAVGDRRGHATFVVTDPGAAGLLVPRRDDLRVLAIHSGRMGGPVQHLVAVCRDDHGRVGKDLPSEDERAHALLHLESPFFEEVEHAIPVIALEFDLPVLDGAPDSERTLEFGGQFSEVDNQGVESLVSVTHGSVYALVTHSPVVATGFTRRARLLRTMSATDHNRLSEEESPYLRQHADNPVNWQPWDDDALDAAEERDVPIFLSVGYSACHWCHVMEDESFQNEEIAEQLNEHFVPIKVDREERPDLDSIYQTICQLVTRRGGWPLSVWLTPDGRPFYVGTYFPAQSQRGMPGFGDLLENIRESWETDREEIENRADQWTAALDDQLEDVPEAGDRPGDDALTTAAESALRAADREHGGFGRNGPKFPQPARLDLLARAYDRTGNESYREVVTETLDAMADRGMNDHVGGGFHRYATDREWVVPHFEKMLYDNAELPKAYLAGYQMTGEERYARAARETFAFVSRELTHPEGGFYSTLDAQSEVPESRHDPEADEADDEEGAFYVWTPEEVREAIEDDDLAEQRSAGSRTRSDDLAELFCDRYGVTEAGNFEGTNVLTLSASIDSLAEEYDLDPESVRDRLETARERIFEAREQRPRPRRDEKILAGWNGLMVSALAAGGLVLNEGYADRAVAALEFAREHFWDDEEHHLSRRYKDGEVEIDGYLEDYAFLARGAFDCYQATGEVDHLGFALDLAQAIEREFWDEERGTLYFTPATGEDLVTRPQELRDQSTPSSLGVAADVLLSLAPFASDSDFEGIVETVLERHGDRIEGSPLEHPSLLMAADRFETGSLELTVAAEELPEEWRERLAETYLPGRILARRPSTEDGLDDWLDQLELDEAPPIWADREQRDGEPTAYVCRSFTCSPPVTDIEEAMDWVGKLDPASAGGADRSG